MQNFSLALLLSSMVYLGSLLIFYMLSYFKEPSVKSLQVFTYIALPSIVVKCGYKLLCSASNLKDLAIFQENVGYKIAYKCNSYEWLKSQQIHIWVA